MKTVRSFDVNPKEIEAIKIAIAISLKVTAKGARRGGGAAASGFRDMAVELLQRLTELERE